MDAESRLPARAQPQVWDNDNAIDVGDAVEFDAHDALLRMDARRFSATAREILRAGSDIDDLVIESGAIQSWLNGNPQAERTFRAEIDPEDFRAWLFSAGLEEDEAVKLDEEAMEGLKARLGRPKPILLDLVREIEDTGTPAALAAAAALGSLLGSSKDGHSFVDGLRDLAAIIENAADKAAEIVEGDDREAALPSP